MKWLPLAWRNVRRNRRRSLITILLACTGTAALLLASGFALSTYEALREMSARQIGHVVVAHREYFHNDEDAPLSHGLGDSQTVMSDLLADPRVATVVPRLNYSGLISNGDSSAIFLGTGVDPEGEFRINGALTPVEQGRALSTHPAAQGDPEVMLARELARKLKAGVGDTLTLLTTTVDGALNGIDVQVVGIYGTGTPELDERALLTDVATAQRLLRTDKVSTLAVYLHDRDGAPAFAAERARAWPDRALRTWEDLASFYAKVRALYDRIFGVLGIIIVVMVFFAVTNTMSMSVTERTREIGTLAALGTSPGRIVANFATESGIIGLLGAVAGMVLAGVVTLLLHVFPVMMPPPPGRTEGYPLLFYFSPAVYGTVAVIIIAAAVLAALLAARRGVGKPIVEALSHV